MGGDRGDTTTARCDDEVHLRYSRGAVASTRGEGRTPLTRMKPLFPKANFMSHEISENFQFCFKKIFLLEWCECWFCPRVPQVKRKIF